MKTKLFGLLLVAALLLGSVLPASALHVFDANQTYALTDAQIDALEATAQQIENTYNVYAMITLTDDLDNYESIEALALAQLNAERGTRDGIMLAVCDETDSAAYTTQIAGAHAAEKFPAQVLTAFETSFASISTYYEACVSFYALVESMLKSANAAAAPDAPAPAAEAPAATAQHVFDAAFLLKEGALKSIESRAAKIEADTGFCPLILLCSEEDLGDESPMRYAETSFLQKKENPDGLVLLVSIEPNEQERFFLQPMGRGVYYFDDDVTGAFEDRYDAAQTYGDACTAFLDFIEETLTDGGWSKQGALSRMKTDGEKAPLLVDDAGLLSAADAAALQEKLQAYSDELNCDFVIVTTNTTEGMDTKGYADRFYDSFGYGRGDDRSGVLFLLSMEDRAWWISTTGEAANKAFGSQSRSEAAVSQVSDRLHDNDFAAALPKLTDMLYKGVKKVVHPFVSPVWLLVSLGVAFVISYLIQKGRAASLKSVRQQQNATAYIVPESLQLETQSDDFIRTDTSRTAIPKSTSSSSSSRGGSSGGHGGGGGHF
ncbi:MAG: TPM domain-containing protein [Clostridia bacterium]|nr:TPM domain-containing protein [Clostridia bacterium]